MMQTPSQVEREKLLREAEYKELLADDVERCPDAYQGPLLRAKARELRAEADAV
jgi:hypothetical protein